MALQVAIENPSTNVRINSRTMRVIIAGGRDFADWGKMDLALRIIFRKAMPEVIISGDARGADRLGAKWAKDHNIPVKHYPAAWSKYGKSAGYKRNITMAENADALIAFWDGKSKGTKHMIDIAKEHGLKIRVVAY